MALWESCNDRAVGQKGNDESALFESGQHEWVTLGMIRCEIPGWSNTRTRHERPRRACGSIRLLSLHGSTGKRAWAGLKDRLRPTRFRWWHRFAVLLEVVPNRLFQ